MSDYKYLDWVKMVLVAANARVPRLQKSAITEIGEFASRAVARGDIVQAGDDIMTADGKTPENFVDDIVSTRPHMEVPPEVVEVTDQTWLSGSLTEQGIRYNQIRAVFGKGKAGDDLAAAAFATEAALYGTKPGSIRPGIAPGTKVEVEAGAAPKGSNPWIKDQWRGTEEARIKKIESIIMLDTAMAARMANKEAGVSISGQPLRVVKSY
jgi:hypothetical protein